MALIYGQLVKAGLEVSASDLSGTITGLMSWNSTSGQMKVSDGTNVRSILRNDLKAIIGNNGTANNNIRFHRGASPVLQFVQGGDATAEGTLSTSLAQTSGRVENYTDATLPAFGNAGRLAWVTDQTTLKVDTGSAWVLVGSGGGASSLRWYEPDAMGPLKSVQANGMEIYTFGSSDDLSILCKITVPESYIGGSQAFLRYGKVFSSINTGNFLFRAISYLFKAGIDATSVPTGYTSTNSQQAIAGTANQIVTMTSLDLTNAAGEINSVAIAAGDTILVKLQRLVTVETSGVAGDVNLIIDSFSVDLTE